MPIYEYACPECGARFERRLSSAQRHEPQPCPQCGATRAALQMSAPVVMGSRSDPSMGVCPTSGQPCGCAHAIRN